MRGVNRVIDGRLSELTIDQPYASVCSDRELWLRRAGDLDAGGQGILRERRKTHCQHAREDGRAAKEEVSDCATTQRSFLT